MVTHFTTFGKRFWGWGWGGRGERVNVCFKYELILEISVCWLKFNYLTISHQIFNVPIDVSWKVETRHPFLDWKTLVYGRCQSGVFFQFCKYKEFGEIFPKIPNLVEKFWSKTWEILSPKKPPISTPGFFSTLWCWKKIWIFQWNYKISHIYTRKTKLSPFFDK